MNIERLTAIAEWLEAGAPERDGVQYFDMKWWNSDLKSITGYCGTVCCIGGAASLWWSTCRYSDDHAAEALGLNYSTANQLFYPTDSDQLRRLGRDARGAAMTNTLRVLASIGFAFLAAAGLMFVGAVL
jgi:hypothetical protein